jgi:1,4-alpha-glucan branching enzyme
MFNREQQVVHLNRIMGKNPIVLSPYDAELFGHWWFEGPQFLDYLYRKIHHDQESLEAITPLEYLERHPRNQVSTPSFSSWGYKGYAEYWLEGSNDWIYRHLEHAADGMVELATQHRNANGLLERALNQAARELLLAQSSDWAFIMKTGTTVPYAVKRTRDHLLRFADLAAMIRAGAINEGTLHDLEQRDNVFPAIDYRAYCEG